MDIDVHSYQEELDTIVAEANAVLGRMNEINDRYHAVQALVDALEKDFGEAKTMIDQKVAEYSGEIETFCRNAESVLGNFDHEIADAFNTAANGLMSKVTELEQHFTQQTTATYAQIDKSHGILQHLGELVKNAQQESHTSIATAIAQVKDNASHFGQEFDGTTHPSMTAFDEWLQHAKEQGEAHANEHHDQMEQVKQQTDEHLQQHLYEPVHTHVQETHDLFEQIQGAVLDAHIQQMIHHGRDKIETECKHTINDVCQKVKQKVDEIIDHMHKATDGSAVPREAMKPLIDGIEGLIKPVEETIGNVKSVAAAVGFDL